MTARTLILLGLLAACTPSIEDYPDELQRAVCEWQTRCHGFARVDDCVDSARPADPSAAAYVLRASAAGTLEFDREAAAACLDEVRARGCEDPDPPDPEPCARVYRGRVGRNLPCMSSAECAGEGAVCGFDPGCDEACCVGRCRVPAEPLALGEPCGGGARCVDEGFCAADPNTGAPTVCTPRVAAGEPCPNFEPCAPGAECDGATCVEVPVRAEGEPCGFEAGTCAEGLECNGGADAGARCVRPAALGAPCDPAGPVRCARFDTRCDPVRRLCELLPGPGAACDQACRGHASCQYSGGGPDAAVGTCVAYATLGDACGDDSPGCLGWLECQSGRCARPEASPGPVCEVPGVD
jgi:hypothetical protein